MRRISREQALDLYRNADLLELGRMADEVREVLHPDGVASFVVDRNINYTNVCINHCRFCAFYREPGSPDAYVLSREELFRKIDETVGNGGTQILIQGGLHPELDLSFYVEMLSSIRQRYDINIHGFSPPEIEYIADKSSLSISETLKVLKDAGLDSIPGGGAEVLSDRVREVLSPRKIRTSQWLEVMEEAHKLGMKTTATMMFGSVEEPEDIVEHLNVIRSLQDRTGGFTAFIPWTFQPGNTELGSKGQVEGAGFSPVGPATALDYLRVLALSRVCLDNFANIQASWVTQGLKVAQVALRFGANDFGSTMLEENVVKAAGVCYRVSKDDIINAIRSSGFIPAQRDTCYNMLRYYK
ncbi:aminodeoxyfutalosine synthase [bacterium BMS3Bbin06]|nr:aminodeoxyfutalosine synthase [bacterium BMS3Abin08]GBE34088.1 aminodeoxyfutalosine synthase [bacterium BMS3Bbin06]HDY70519.1 dehypoxanthine futalosine cyclase [Nitrospirota bacterium]